MSCTSAPGGWDGKDATDSLLARADFAPILLRIIKRKTFVPGPFKLGRAQLCLNVLSLIWIAISLVSSTELYTRTHHKLFQASRVDGYAVSACNGLW